MLNRAQVVPGDRLIDFIVPFLSLEQSVELLANRKPETHNLQPGGTVIMPSPVMDFGSMPTEAHVLRVLVASALGPYLSHGNYGACMYVAGHGALDALEQTP